MIKSVFYVYRTERKKLFENYKKKKEPDNLLYGLNHLENLGYKCIFSDIAYSKLNILRFLLFPIEHLVIKLTSLGFKIDQAILLLPLLKKSDVIITTVDSAGLPILFLKKIGILKKPVLFISVGLINELILRKKNLVFRLYGSLLNEAELIICYSRIEKKLFEKCYIQLRKRIKFVNFGIDNIFFKKKKTGKKYIFSIGGDRSRDFEFLSKIALILPDQRFVLLTYQSNVKGIKFPSNVKLVFNKSYLEVKRLYENASLVFLPLKELSRASGQISFLESMALNKKIVVTRVKGITDPYNSFTSSRYNVYLYEIDNLKSAKAAILRALNQQIREFEFPGELSSQNLAINLDKLIKDLIW